MFLRDFKVRTRRSAQEIEDLAAYWRRIDGNEYNPQIDMVRFLYRTIPPNIKGKELVITENDDLKIDSPAYVQFRELESKIIRARLFIEKETVLHARLGSADAKYIIAHEAGHIIMHDANCLRLSSNPDEKLKAFDREDLAEWQAHRFARALLAPFNLAKHFRSSEELLRVFDISEDTAQRRLDDFKEFQIFDGNACEECGNFTLVRNGINLRCSSCGSTTGCS